MFLIQQLLQDLRVVRSTVRGGLVLMMMVMDCPCVAVVGAMVRQQMTYSVHLTKWKLSSLVLCVCLQEDILRFLFPFSSSYFCFIERG